MISFRGNRWGPDITKENTPEHVRAALKFGFWVIVDVWYVNGWVYLGKVGPSYVVSSNFLELIDRVLCWPRSAPAVKYVNDKGLSSISWDGESSVASVCLAGSQDIKTVFMEDSLEAKDSQVDGGCWGICSNWVGRLKTENENKCWSK
jgi:hypothetical protein